MSTLVLASGSPRRAALLRQLGLSFTVVVPEIDECPAAGETPYAYVWRMSAEKMDRARTMLAGQDDTVIVTADTEVVLDETSLGKPADEADCVRMLLSLSGRRHAVMTGVTVAGPAGAATFVVETKVAFRPLTAAECSNYWATGEPGDKAGGYGIQGIGAIFVERIEGSYSNVVGLPLMEVAGRLEEQGISCLPDRHQRRGAREEL